MSIVLWTYMGVLFSFGLDVFSMLVFVLGIRADEAGGGEEACESANMQELSAMQMGFVPSVGIATALWGLVKGIYSFA